MTRRTTGTEVCVRARLDRSRRAGGAIKKKEKKKRANNESASEALSPQRKGLTSLAMMRNEKEEGGLEGTSNDEE